VKVSFFNSGQRKYLLPRTQALRPRQETPEQRSARLAREQMLFGLREEDLRKSIRAAQALGVDKTAYRFFTVDPQKGRQAIGSGGLVKSLEKRAFD
jgi:hypothetical protein